MQFAIPSKGRAGRTKTQGVLSNAVFYVPENESESYKKAMPRSKVVAVPLEVKGITQTRNFILKEAKDRWIVMVDDDIKAQGWVQMLADRSKHRKLTEEDWEKICRRLFEATEDLGWKIWGVATQNAKRSVYPYKPILSRSYITASFMGIVNDGTYPFDESFPVKEDYEIGLRHIKDFGGVMAARFCYWENSHWTDDGGCKDYRSGKMELDCINKLVKKYPGMIRQITRGGSNYSISLEF